MHFFRFMCEVCLITGNALACEVKLRGFPRAYVGKTPLRLVVSTIIARKKKTPLKKNFEWSQRLEVVFNDVVKVCDIYKGAKDTFVEVSQGDPKETKENSQNRPPRFTYIARNGNQKVHFASPPPK